MFWNPTKGLNKIIEMAHTLALPNVELIHKLGWDNVVPDLLNQKEEL
jgi:hypothetical protein